MALVQGEVDICTRAYDRIGAGTFTVANQATNNQGIRAARHYNKIRKATLRLFDWPFARDRKELDQLYVLTIDSAPTSAWAEDDTITGQTSGVTCRIVEITSTTSYIVTEPSGDWTDGEVLSNGAGTRDCAAGYPTDAEYEPDFGYSAAFALPEDYLKLTRHYTEVPSDFRKQRWHIEGRKFLFDDSTCQIQYIKDFTDTALFDPLFEEVLVLNLALTLLPASAGTGKLGLKQELKDDIKKFYKEVRAAIRNENNTSGRSDWNYARYGSRTFPQTTS